METYEPIGYNHELVERVERLFVDGDATTHKILHAIIDASTE